MTSVDEILENTTASPSPVHSPNGRPPRAATGPSPVLVLALAFLVGVAAARFLARRAHVGSRA